MSTQKFMGKNSLIKRLAAQVGSEEMAIGLLQKRGQLKPGTTELTAEGQKRDNMTAEQRAVDRASQRSNRKPTEYAYNAKTNRATLKKVKGK